ncbi:MAG: glycosyltransferase, partial [Prevotella sp.]
RLSWKSFKWGMLVCHQAFYARTDIARANPYNLGYRFSADVDWCIRVMKEAERRSLPIVDAHATLANYTEEGQTTKHHRESLKERFRVMVSHYGLPLTLLMHCWFVVRAKLKP